MLSSTYRAADGKVPWDPGTPMRTEEQEACRLMGGNIEDRSDDKKDPIHDPQGSADLSKRPPIEHNRREVQKNVGKQNRWLQWITPLNLLYIIDPITIRTKEDEKESAQPERPAFPTEQ
jgi:hypothetical protein